MNSIKAGDSQTGYGRPQDVLDDHALTLEKKLIVLESWQNDLLELQRADDENMTGATVKPGQTAKRLAEVTKAIHQLRNQQ